MEKQNTKALTMRLPTEVHKKLRLLAVYEERTMTDILIECIDERFERHEKGQQRDH